MFKSLLNREISLVFSSTSSLIFGIIFFLVNGLMLYLFPGNYNIFDNGYASLDRFFSLSSIILVFLIPALTMRSISEEKLTKTLYLQYSRPISISALFFSKLLSNFLYIFFILLCSSIYLFTIYKLGSPIGNIDLSVVFVSYLGLILVSVVFISYGILASSFSKYSVLSFIIALFFNCILFYGFDFLSGIVVSGKTSIFIQSLGLFSHYKNFIKGVLNTTDLLVFINYTLTAWCIFILVLRFKIRIVRTRAFCIVLLLLFINVLNSVLSSKKVDFTDDKRYTLSDSTVKYLKSLDAELNKTIKVNLYLSGNINYSFQRLANATLDILSNFNQNLNKPIEVKQMNIEDIVSSTNATYMVKKEMPPITLNEKSRDGKITQQLIYPYVEIIYDQDTIHNLLLKNVSGYTAEEKINASIESLESDLIQSINVLTSKEEQHIAFIEGHKELDRAYIYDVEEALSKYYFIDRGQIGNNIGVLDDFKVVVVAGPKEKYTETEKFILDQYIMSGGRVLWLIDGTYLSEEDLQEKGQSASIKNDINLDDLLFTYGIRVNSDLIQDTQSSEILLNNGINSQPIATPWYYAPILLPSLDNVITKNIGGIKSEFVSSIDFIKNKDAVTKKVLLTSSANSHIVNVPETIDFDFNRIESKKDYFNQSYLITAVALDGAFSSAFLNRIIPDSIVVDKDYPLRKISKPTKMIVLSSSSIIKNEIIGEGNQTQVLPLGLDRLSGNQFGNKEFIVNAVNWLADNSTMINIVAKKQNLRLLDRHKLSIERNWYVYLNLLLPIFIVSLVYAFLILYRKIRYT